MWIQIHFWFKRNKEFYLTTQQLSKKQLKEFYIFLAQIIKRYNPQRKFFLFEYEPHCFLAMKLKPFFLLFNNFHLDNKITIPKFIINLKYKFNTHEENNGKEFIDIMDIFCDNTLKLKPCLPFGEHLFNKIAHCILNQGGHTLIGELKQWKNVYENLDKKIKETKLLINRWKKNRDRILKQEKK